MTRPGNWPDVSFTGTPLSGSFITLDWHSYRTVHQDVFYQAGLLPGTVLSTVAGREGLEACLGPGELVAEYDPELIVEVSPSQLKGTTYGSVCHALRVGHHYPTRLLCSISRALVNERQVFRNLSPTPTGWRIDLNPPLAGVVTRLSARPADGTQLRESRVDADLLRWQLFQSGPGLQARRRDVLPDWPAEADLKREDEHDDEVFYAEPRFVTHIDDTTIAQIAALYARLIPPGARVLDIMSSWISHLPAGVAFGKVTGLGMNRKELEENSALDELHVHNLNRDSRLPFPDHSFDAVVCAVSVEYLSDPLPVFEDVRRVLAPGGIFINVFSNRCFPTKAIALWARLHEFERMGLVAHFYHQTGYADVNTWSLRGLPRPTSDPYAMHNSESDPVYAVWARN